MCVYVRESESESEGRWNESQYSWETLQGQVYLKYPNKMKTWEDTCFQLDVCNLN